MLFVLVFIFCQRNLSMLFFEGTDAVVNQVHDLSTATASIVFCHIIEFFQSICINADTDVLLLFYKNTTFALKLSLF